MNKLFQRKPPQDLQAIADQIWSAWLRGERVVICYPKRFGKSWLAKELERRKKKFLNEMGNGNEGDKNPKKGNLHNGNGTIHCQRKC